MSPSNCSFRHEIVILLLFACLKMTKCEVANRHIQRHTSLECELVIGGLGKLQAQESENHLTANCNRKREIEVVVVQPEQDAGRRACLQLEGVICVVDDVLQTPRENQERV